MPVAVALYDGIDELQWAVPNGFRGDSPDVDAKKEGDQLYIVFREASGDCPAGCITDALFYFIWQDGELVEMSERDAAREPIFSELVDRATHGRRDK